MFEQEFYIAKLIGAYVQETISEEDLKQLNAWIAESPQNRLHFEQTYQEHILSHKLKTYQNVDGASVWAKTINRIDKEDAGFIKSYKKPRIVQLRRWSIAAMIAGIVFVTSLITYNQFRSSQPLKAEYVQDVAPGTKGATLILADGRRVRLLDEMSGPIAEEAGVRITKSADEQLIYELKGNDTEGDKENTLVTSNGETYQVRLPDGTKVWLNAGSSLTYTPKLVKAGKRRVKLVGEAYFEVSKDKSKPFIVQTHSQEVEVLGTSFNINAYLDEPVTNTTLVEGSIKINTKKGAHIVKPGEQAVNNGKDIQIARAVLENITDWKDGDFYLNHLDFKVAMRKIARWYDVDIIYDGSVPDGMESGGWIARNKPLSQVLKSIESSGMARFRIEGRTIHVIR